MTIEPKLREKYLVSTQEYENNKMTKIEPEPKLSEKYERAYQAAQQAEQQHNKAVADYDAERISEEELLEAFIEHGKASRVFDAAYIEEQNR